MHLHATSTAVSMQVVVHIPPVRELSAKEQLARVSAAGVWHEAYRATGENCGKVDGWMDGWLDGWHRHRKANHTAQSSMAL
jgi:hypothetical protein